MIYKVIQSYFRHPIVSALFSLPVSTPLHQCFHDSFILPHHHHLKRHLINFCSGLIISVLLTPLFVYLALSFLNTTNIPVSSAISHLPFSPLPSILFISFSLYSEVKGDLSLPPIKSLHSFIQLIYIPQISEVILCCPSGSLNMRFSSSIHVEPSNLHDFIIPYSYLVFHCDIPGL